MKLRRQLLLALAVTATITVAGCSGESRTAGTNPLQPTQQPTLPHVRVAFLPIADCAQLFIAQDRGFFREEGVDVDARVFASGVKALEALGTGDTDIAYSAVAPLILARSRGLDFVALTGGPAEDTAHAEHAILVAKGSLIRTARDLDGKTIAFIAFRSIDEPFVKEWLQKHGADVQKVTFAEVPFPQMETVLLSGRIAAAASIEPFVTVARRNGKTLVLAHNYIDIQPLTEIGSYNARESILNTKRDGLERFRHAMNRATEYANAHPDEVKATVARHTKLDAALAREMTLPLYTKHLTPEGLQSVMDLMLKWKVLDKPLDPHQLIR